MTIWLPTVHQSNNPLYIEIADSIEQDIAAGKLPPGSKLPPVRNVAFDIGVTVGTVSRAYALARERGLVSGEVGRGTYILDGQAPAIEELPPSPPVPVGMDTRIGNLPKHRNSGRTDLSFCSATNVGQAEEIAALASQIASAVPEKMTDYIQGVPENWLAAGCKWLSVGDWEPDIESIVPTGGVRAGAIAIIASMTRPGDKIAFEGLSYTSAVRSASLMGRRITPVEFDENGIIPASLERVCAQQHPKLLYLMSDVHNPTLSILPLERRREIADIAHKYNMWILDDAIYSSLAGAHLPTFNSLLPELSFRVNGMAKGVSVSPRSGWIACPPRLSGRIFKAHKMATGSGSFWMSELAAKLVLDGNAFEIQNRIRVENRKRLDIAREVLPEEMLTSTGDCPYIWLKLPEPWLSGTFKNAAADHGISISSEDDYKVSRLDQTFHGVRIGLNSLVSLDDLKSALQTLRGILDSGIAGYDRNE